MNKKYLTIVSFAVLLILASLFLNSKKGQETVYIQYPEFAPDFYVALEEGYQASAFIREDLLAEFLEYFESAINPELQLKTARGYEYFIEEGNDSSCIATVYCVQNDSYVIIAMEKTAYKETDGLWQVVSYTITR